MNYTWDKIERSVISLGFKLYKDDWKPDYIVGIVPSGLVPATMLADMLEVPLHTLDVLNHESNCWMAEDAFGYEHNRGTTLNDIENWSNENCKNILIVNDVHSTDKTVEWIKKDWQSGCLPKHGWWSEVWHKNVKFASIIEDTSVNESVDYSVHEVNKHEKEYKVKFPWEILK